MTMIKTAILDLDGTLIKGMEMIEGAADAVSQLRDNGIETVFLTNSAVRSRADMVTVLHDAGIEASIRDVYSGAYLMARYLQDHYEGKPVYMIGEKGFKTELDSLSIKQDDHAEIVVIGLDHDFTYEKLANAHLILRHGGILLGSNRDNTYPIEDGDMPGAGSLLSALETCSEKKATVVGKPESLALDIILKEHRTEKDEVIIVGDRIETDILFAKNCGVKSALVLSGISKKEDIKEIKPDFVLDSIVNLPSSL